MPCRLDRHHHAVSPSAHWSRPTHDGLDVALVGQRASPRTSGSGSAGDGRRSASCTPSTDAAGGGGAALCARLCQCGPRSSTRRYLVEWKGQRQGCAVRVPTAATYAGHWLRHRVVGERQRRRQRADDEVRLVGAGRRERERQGTAGLAARRAAARVQARARAQVSLRRRRPTRQSPASERERRGWRVGGPARAARMVEAKRKGRAWLRL